MDEPQLSVIKTSHRCTIKVQTLSVRTHSNSGCISVVLQHAGPEAHRVPEDAPLSRLQGT